VLLMMLIAWLPWLLLGGGVLYLGVRAVRALERRGTANTELTDLRERVLALEETVGEQAEELRRVAEGQRFAERLLAERSSPERGATSVERAI
jgi:hypothetical protein